MYLSLNISIFLSLSLSIDTQEELHRRDAVLSEIREAVTLLADQGPPRPAEGTRTIEGDTSPRRLLRRVSPPPRTPQKGTNPKGRSPAGNLSPLHDHNTRVSTRASPGRTPPRHNQSSEPVAPCPHFHRAVAARSSLGGVGGVGVGGGGGGGVSSADEWSSSPPSRSQPLRALAGPATAVADNSPNDDGGRGDNTEGYAYEDEYEYDDDTAVSSMANRNVVFNTAADDNFGAPGQGLAKGLGSVGSVDSFAAGAGSRIGVKVPQPLALPFPRVADLEGVNRVALEKQRHKAAEAAALVNSPGTGRSALYYPSWYDPSRADASVPDSRLALEYVHGYAGETPGGSIGGGGGGGGGGRGGGINERGGGGIANVNGSGQGGGRVGGARNSATRSTNVLWLRTGEVVFPASAVVVIHDFETNRQRFFTGHDEASPPAHSACGIPI